MSYQEGAQVGNAFMNMGRTAMMFGRYHDIQQDRALKLQDRESEERAYKLAGLLANQQAGDEPGGMQQVEGRMPGATGMSNMAVNVPADAKTPEINRGDYSNKEWFKGNSLYQQQRLNDFNIERGKFLLSSEGRKAEAQKIAVRYKKSDDLLNEYKGLKQVGTDKMAMLVVGSKINNLVFPNGFTTEVLTKKDGSFQAKVTNSSGEVELIDLTPENIDNLIAVLDEQVAGFYGKTPQERIELLGNANEMRVRANKQNVFDDMGDEKLQFIAEDGTVYYQFGGNPKRPQIDPQDGSIPPLFYATGVDGKRFSAEEAKGLKLKRRKDVKDKAADEKAALERRGKIATVEKKEAEAIRAKQGVMSDKEKISMNKGMYTAVEKGIETYLENGGDNSKEAVMLEKNRLRADYKSRVDPNYKPDPKSKEMTRKLVVEKTGQTVYFNDAGKAFLDSKGKKPLMGATEQENSRSAMTADGSLRRFNVNR